MYRSRVRLALLLPAVLALWACSRTPQFVAKDEPWRADEERACLAAGVVRESSFVAARAPRRPERVRGAEAVHRWRRPRRARCSCGPPRCCAARWCRRSTAGSSAW